MTEETLAFYAFLIIANVYAAAEKWRLAAASMACACVALTIPHLKGLA